MNLGRLVNDYIGIPLVVKDKRQSGGKKNYYDMDGEMLGDDEGDTLGDADGLALGLVVGATVHSSSSIRNNCRLRGCESIVSTTFSHSASLPSYKDSRCSFSPAGAFT